MDNNLLMMCDVDNVLVDFCYTYLDVLKKVCKVYKRFEDITDFDFSKCVSTKEQDQQVWSFIDNNPGLVYSIPEMPDAFRALETLRKMGRVVALTSPHLGPTWQYERTQALMTNFGFSKKDIVFCSDKKLVPADILIEDSLQNVNDYKEAHPNSLVFLLNCPYNQGSTNAIRVKDWKELINKLDVLLTK